jgi:hypothetical protein
MNERIRELAEQATSSRNQYDPKTMMTERIQEFDKDKFARLIVQECIWAFGETRTEPSLEKYILDRLGINNGTTNSRT